jgi:thiol:disulfide interchange protein DsbD
VLVLQAGADGLLHLLIGAVLLAFAAWIHGRMQRAGSARRPAIAVAGVVAGVVAVAATVWQIARIDGLAVPPAPLEASGGAPTDPGARAQWQPWSAAGVSDALARGRPVLVEFTAAWCITCQANKRLVLDRDVVRRAFDAQQVVLLRGDWTRGDPAISAELARFGRNGVPFYLYYASPQEPPRILPELLTVDTVLAALGSLR